MDREVERELKVKRKRARETERESTQKEYNGEDMDIEEGYAKGRNVRRDESRLEMKREKGE